ncbi:ATPase [Streptomyces sp. NPDC051940]|uniref:ATPase n=1 Tax=Streptomyces sp. NPDC051940 TaxID=3155675 RepID=UPI003444FA74
MNWTPYYWGKGDAPDSPRRLPDPPPWRAGRTGPAKRSPATTYEPPAGLVDAVNAALHLRRPLLLTGPAGSGKSTVIEQIAVQTGLGDVLRWHITSRSTLAEALYRYDALGRIHAHALRDGGGAKPVPGAQAAPSGEDDIGDYLQLGPLGTALLPADRPRALLIDEIDKSDLDLPSDLLDVLERGEFEIPELARHPVRTVRVRTAEPGGRVEVEDGLVRCREFPVIVLTSNGERDFPPPFLRRCVRFDMPPLSRDVLARIVTAHLDDVDEQDPTTATLLTAFVEQLGQGQHLAIDQLLNAVYLLKEGDLEDGEQRDRLQQLLLKELGRA